MLVCLSETAWVESVVRGSKEIEFINNGSDIILRLNQRPWSDDEDDENASKSGADYRQLFDYCNYTAPQAESCKWNSSRIDDIGNMAAPLQPNILYEIRFYKIHINSSSLHNQPMTRNSTSSKEEKRNSYTLPLAFRTPSPGEAISSRIHQTNMHGTKLYLFKFNTSLSWFLHMWKFRSKLLSSSFTLIYLQPSEQAMLPSYCIYQGEYSSHK